LPFCRFAERRTRRRSAKRAPRLFPLAVAEIGHIEKVADGRHVRRHVGIVRPRDGIGQIVAAALGERAELLAR